MHIAEGILPLWQAALWTVTATPFVVLSVYQIERRLRTDTGMKRVLHS